MGNLAERAEVEAAAPKPPTPKQVITKLLDNNKGAIGLSLPKGMDQDRFVRLLLTATVTNPTLLECDPNTFLRAGVLSAQLGLEPNDPREEAFLIPFNDKRNRYGKVVNFIIGYRGLMKLARQSGMVTSIHSFPVFAGDHFRYELGMEPRIEHVPDEDAEGYWDFKFLTHAYAVAKVGGDPQFVVVSRKQIDATRARSKAADSGPWVTDPIAMSVKTAIRRLCSQLPQSPQMAQALSVEEHGLVMADLPALPEHRADDEDALDAIDAESTEVDSVPEGVDHETGEVIDVTGTEEPPADDAPEFGPDDPGRPF